MAVFEMVFNEEGEEEYILMWIGGEGNRPIVLEKKDFEPLWNVLAHAKRKDGKKVK